MERAVEWNDTVDRQWIRGAKEQVSWCVGYVKSSNLRTDLNEVKLAYIFCGRKKDNNNNKHPIDTSSQEIVEWQWLDVSLESGSCDPDHAPFRGNLSSKS